MLAYANALGHPFVFDDSATIVGNPTIRPLASSIWGGPAQSATAGRPVVNIAFALNYAVGGVAPWGYHAVNLAVHIACGLLLFGLMRRMLRLPLGAAWSDGQETGLAAVIALLWTLHPLNSEVVNYVTQRSEGLMALALLTTLYCGVRALAESKPQRWRVASVAACAVGMTCKESMVTAPVLMLLLEVTFTRRSLREVLSERSIYYGALFATWLVLAGLIVEGPRWRSAGFSSGVSAWSYFLNQAPMIARYLRLAIIPIGLVLDYGEPLPQTLGAVIAPAIIVVALLVASVAAWRTAPLFGFLGAWFFITLAPTSSIVPIATELGAERRMYLPLVAVLAALVLLGARLLARVAPDASRLTLARAVVATLCVALAALTAVRNREYATGLGIWQTVVERWPSGRGHYNYAIELNEAGRRAEALEQYRLAAPTSADAHYALGFELQADGRYDEALEHYRTFISLKPYDIVVPKAYHQIGRTLVAQGKRDEALMAFKEVLARKPGDVDSLAGIADTLLALERLPEAVTAYQTYLRAMPDRTDAMMNLGLALTRLDRDAEARDLFATVVQREPANVAAHVNLAYALANTGRYGESLQEFRRAAQLEKDPEMLAVINAAIAQLLGSH